MIREILTQQRRKILDRWTELVLDAYPSESASFLKEQKDRFGNPVGYTIAGGLGAIYDGLFGGGEDTGIEQAVGDIIRMRAVQEFTPSEAVGFMTPLKEAIKEAVEAAGPDRTTGVDGPSFAELVRLHAEIDRVTLLAVDSYVGCRDAIHRARMREARAGGMIGAAMMDRRNR